VAGLVTAASDQKTIHARRNLEMKMLMENWNTFVSESKEDHIKGIEAKLERLSDAIDDATRGMENMERGVGYSSTPDEDMMDIRSTNQYFAKQVEVMNLEDKIDLLKKQLEQLKQDVPGQLEKPS
jgi:hypothetical protein